jgi:hypothetical protein
VWGARVWSEVGHGRYRRDRSGSGDRAVRVPTEMGRDRNGIRMQARRTGFRTGQAALTEYRRLCRQRDARHPKPRLSDTVQDICQGWLRAREQELQPNTLYNYTWLLGLIYPYVGRVRASRLSARMVEGAYRDLDASGYSRTTLRTLDLVLAKAFGDLAGRTLGARQPRETDDVRRYGRWLRPAASASSSEVIGCIRCGGCCWWPACGVASCAACGTVTSSRNREPSRCAGNSSSRNPRARSG